MKTKLILLALFFSSSIYTQNPSLDVLFVYPKKLKKDREGSTIITEAEFNTKAQKVVEGVNDIYENSGAIQRMKVQGTLALDINKDIMNDIAMTIVNVSNLTYYLSNRSTGSKNGDNAYQQIVNKRKELRADAVVVINYYENGSNPGANGSLNPHSAYVKMNCESFDANTVAHELGHVQGLTHEMGGTFPYYSNVIGKRSIMASNCVNRGKDEIKNFTGSNSYNEKDHIYLKCHWDCVSILNDTAHEFCNYGNLIAADEPYVERLFPTAKISHLAMRDDCTALGVMLDGTLWEWIGYRWVKKDVTGDIKQVEINERNLAFVLSNDGVLSSIYNSGRANMSCPYSIKKFALEGNTVWILSNENKVYKRIGSSSWTEYINNHKTEGWKDVSAGNEGNVWAVSLSGDGHQLKNDRFEFRNLSNIKSITAGVNNSVILIPESGRMKYKLPMSNRFFDLTVTSPCQLCDCRENPEVNCQEVDEVRASKVFMYDENFIWAVNSENCIYKYMPNKGFLPMQSIGQSKNSSSRCWYKKEN